MKDLVISGNTIHLTDGLYSLNDLHKAAGGEKKHQPANWLALQQTLDLVKELVTPENTGVEQNQTLTKEQVLKVVNGGSSPGTFVCKELVYAYAMWISPAFNLRVIRAFDQMATQPDTVKIPPVTGILSAPAADFQALYSMLRTMELDKNAAAIGANGAVIRTYGVNLLELTGQTRLLSETQKDWFIPTELGKMLEPNMKPAEVNIHLAASGLQIKNPATNRWELTEAGHKYGRLVELTPAHGGKMRPQILWTSGVLPIIKRSVQSLAQDS
jgi:hypothetical protein